MRVTIDSKTWKEWNGETGLVIAWYNAAWSDTNEAMRVGLVRLDSVYVAGMALSVRFPESELIEIT